MVDKELVSVIVPVYNVEPYLEECISSIARQTYDNLEIFLIDDGSTDGSGLLCDIWKEKDTRIRVIHQKNRGVSAARNAALDVCAGEWIVFVDSDDAACDDYVETLFNLTIKSNALVAQCDDVTYGNCISIGEKVETLMPYVDYILSDYYKVVPWGKIYHKTCFEQLRFPEGRIHEDVATIYQILYFARNIAITSEQKYYYRRRDDSIMANGRFYAQKLDILFSLKEQICFFRNNEETLLMRKAIRDYGYELLHCYNGTVKILKDKKRAKQILEEYRKNYSEMKKDRDISLKTKVLLRICCIFPRVWSLIE